MESTFDFSKLFSVQITDRFFLIGLIIFAIGIIFLLRYLIKAITISIQRILHPLPWYSEKLSNKYLMALLFLVISVIGLVWMYTGALMQNYQPTPKAVIVGTVEIIRLSGERFSAKFVASYEKFPETTIKRELTGNQWAIGGAFLDFPGYLNFIGLRDGHQVLGFFAKDIRVLREPESTYLAKMDRQPDVLWKTASRIQKAIKSKYADFHISPLMLAETGNYEIYAASAGYVLKRIGKR